MDWIKGWWSGKQNTGAAQGAAAGPQAGMPNVQQGQGGAPRTGTPPPSPGGRRRAGSGSGAIEVPARTFSPTDARTGRVNKVNEFDAGQYGRGFCSSGERNCVLFTKEGGHLAVGLRLMPSGGGKKQETTINLRHGEPVPGAVRANLKIGGQTIPANYVAALPHAEQDPACHIYTVKDNVYLRLNTTTGAYSFIVVDPAKGRGVVPSSQPAHMPSMVPAPYFNPAQQPPFAPPPMQWGMAAGSPMPPPAGAASQYQQGFPQYPGNDPRFAPAAQQGASQQPLMYADLAGIDITPSAPPSPPDYAEADLEAPPAYTPPSPEWSTAAMTASKPEGTARSEIKTIDQLRAAIEEDLQKICRSFKPGSPAYVGAEQYLGMLKRAPNDLDLNYVATKTAELLDAAFVRNAYADNCTPAWAGTKATVRPRTGFALYYPGVQELTAQAAAPSTPVTPSAPLRHDAVDTSSSQRVIGDDDLRAAYQVLQAPSTSDLELKRAANIIMAHPKVSPGFKKTMQGCLADLSDPQEAQDAREWLTKQSPIMLRDMFERGFFDTAAPSTTVYTQPSRSGSPRRSGLQERMEAEFDPRDEAPQPSVRSATATTTTGVAAAASQNVQATAQAKIVKTLISKMRKVARAWVQTGAVPDKKQRELYENWVAWQSAVGVDAAKLEFLPKKDVEWRGGDTRETMMARRLAETDILSELEAMEAVVTGTSRAAGWAMPTLEKSAEAYLRESM